MVLLQADENFNHRGLRGLRRRLLTIDCLPAQETEVYQHDYQDLLDWAAMHNRVVLTHDVNTMTNYAYWDNSLPSLASIGGVDNYPSFANSIHSPHQ